MESRFTPLVSHGCFLFTNPEVCQTLSFGVFIEDLKKIIYFWLCWVFIVACRLSLVATSGGYSLVAGLRLVSSLIVGHRL